MKFELHQFQEVALNKLRNVTASAIGSYQLTSVPQIISYQAPTGAGKTIIISSLIEHILCGDDSFMEQPNAIFLWLSDSPQLNEQSKLKIETLADKVRPGQCVTITEDSFDRETLEDGHIYFLNTQKLSISSNLTKHSDGRQYTIWETLSNTALRKANHFYFIIDEAHRGAQKKSDMATANTIMQKFLKGSPGDGLPPMPVVIGMSATSERFDTLAAGLQTSSVTKVVTKPADVRSSGLLKDKIIISYPETEGNDMAVLQAAAEEWQDKWAHWTLYCKEQKYAYVNPIFVIQVMNGNRSVVSTTDLDECLRTIEEKTGDRFNEGEVVHAFGESTPTLQINGLDVPYCEPSRISDDRRIKVVFFKETLSTGWDCPRAECMMSFRHASDHTYVAQLLGRMIRTPRAQRVLVDESLNDVHLFLPQFNENTVLEVVESLSDEEGAQIPTEIETECLDGDRTVELGLDPTFERRPKPGEKRDPNQMSFFDNQEGTSEAGKAPKEGNKSEETPTKPDDGEKLPPVSEGNSTSEESGEGETRPNETVNPDDSEGKSGQAKEVSGDKETHVPIEGSDIDRKAVVKAVNQMGLLTYKVRDTRRRDYLKSLFMLANFLNRYHIDFDAKTEILTDITKLIRDYVDRLVANKQYADFSMNVMQFKLTSLAFDPFGRAVEDIGPIDSYTTTDADIDRQFRIAETRLGNEGVGKTYIDKYYDIDEDFIKLKIDVILFVAEKTCMDALHDYAEEKFHELNDAHRRHSASLPEKYKNEYDKIVSDGDCISKHSFRLPEILNVKPDVGGKEYFKHLYVEKYGSAIIKLNSWEDAVIEEEKKADDFVCWIRNPSRAPWALCLPYEEDGSFKPTYPDFLIVRKDGDSYVVDVLEPHNPSFVDNLGKAKALAEYAKQCREVGRVQLIRMKKDSTGVERPFRLDMSKSSVRSEIQICASINELNHVFDDYGFFMS